MVALSLTTRQRVLIECRTCRQSWPVTMTVQRLPAPAGEFHCRVTCDPLDRAAMPALTAGHVGPFGPARRKVR